MRGDRISSAVWCGKMHYKKCVWMCRKSSNRLDMGYDLVSMSTAFVRLVMHMCSMCMWGNWGECGVESEYMCGDDRLGDLFVARGMFAMLAKTTVVQPGLLIFKSL